MNDTNSEAAARRIQLLRAMSPSRRLALAWGWSKTLRDLTRANTRNRFRGASEKELDRHFAVQWLGAELAEKAYGPGKADG